MSEKIPSAAATERCRVCGAEVSADAPRCPHCSAAHGEQASCPHCRAIAGASSDNELRFRCDVCGGPRVPRARGFAPSGAEVTHLKRAEQARRSRAAWRASAIAAGLLLPLVGASFLVLALLFGLGAKLLIAGIFAFAPIAAMLAFAISRSKARGAEIAPALDAAWVSVASDVARQNAGSIAPNELAKKLGIDEAQAEELVALLDVNQIIAPTPMRIAASSGAEARDSIDDDESEAEAEAEATAGERARSVKG